MDRKLFEEARETSIKSSNEKDVFSVFQINESAEMAISEIAMQLKSENEDIFCADQPKQIRAVLNGFSLLHCFSATSIHSGRSDSIFWITSTGVNSDLSLEASKRAMS